MSELRKAIESIVRPMVQQGQLNQADKKKPTRAPIKSKRGRAHFRGAGGEAGGGGSIASSLTEPDFTARTYYPEDTYFSSDGLFQLMITPIQGRTYEDQAMTPFVITDAEPV